MLTQHKVQLDLREKNPAMVRPPANPYVVSALDWPEAIMSCSNVWDATWPLLQLYAGLLQTHHFAQLELAPCSAGAAATDHGWCAADGRPRPGQLPAAPSALYRSCGAC